MGVCMDFEPQISVKTADTQSYVAAQSGTLDDHRVTRTDSARRSLAPAPEPARSCWQFGQLLNREPMKLYTHPLSSNARRVSLVAHQLGLQLEEELVDLAKGAQRTPEYLALNPMGKVPTLVDGDLQLTESYAIMIYLCEKTGRRELYPDELATRTEINRWLFWGANEWSPTIGRLNFENMLKPMLGLGAPDPARVQEAENTFKQLAGVLDAKLQTRPFVAGKQLSLADFAVAASLATAVPAKLPLSGFTRVQAWQSGIEQLPAWKATTPAPPKR